MCPQAVPTLQERTGRKLRTRPGGHCSAHPQRTCSPPCGRRRLAQRDAPACGSTASALCAFGKSGTSHPERVRVISLAFTMAAMLIQDSRVRGVPQPQPFQMYVYAVSDIVSGSIAQQGSWEPEVTSALVGKLHEVGRVRRCWFVKVSHLGCEFVTYFRLPRPGARGRGTGVGGDKREGVRRSVLSLVCCAVSAARHCWMLLPVFGLHIAPQHPRPPVL